MNIRLLIVDDEDDFRALLVDTLADNPHYTVVDCDSGEEAIKHLERTTFDVMILDYKMLGMSGLNVLQWMLEQKMETPVLMLTAAGSEIVAVEAMKLGAYDYVRKEQLDMEHLPIIINGVHERYLFRKERDLEKLEHAKSVISLQTFHATIESVGLVTKNALGILSSYLREYEEELSPYVNEEGHAKFEQMFEELKHEFGVISSSVQSMLNWSSIMNERFTKKGESIMPNGNPSKKKETVEK